MPIGYVLLTQERVAFLRGWGRLREGELDGVRRALTTDPRLELGYATLVDLRDLLEWDVDADYIRGYVSPLSVTAARAVLVAPGGIERFVRRFGFEISGDTEHLLTTEDVGEAQDWVGMPRAQALPVVLEKEFDEG